MKRLIPILGTVLLLAGCSPSAAGSGGFRQINMEEAVSLMQKESSYIILDVRTNQEYAEGHIPNAINIPNEAIGIDPLPMLPDKNQLILVYCRSGNRSKQASDKLAKRGYTNIVEFGGIIDWHGEVVTD